MGLAEEWLLFLDINALFDNYDLFQNYDTTLKRQRLNCEVALKNIAEKEKFKFSYMAKKYPE